jgi:DNA topoisomerase-6 subunit B
MARIMNNVLVEREREGDTVRLIVENNSTTNASLEITDIASTEPESANGARIVAMDDEWFVKWHPTVESGDEAVLEYDLDDAADVDVDVAGVEDAKLTVNA